MTPKANKTKKTFLFKYHWDESEYAKGPNKIISALHHLLLTYKIAENIRLLRLVSDSCGAENKNYYMMGMLGYWLLNNSPATLKQIKYFYPMVEHSFWLADRVFARIEKEIKKEDVIINPQGCATIFPNYGTIVPPVSDGINRDWKDHLGNGNFNITLANNLWLNGIKTPEIF